MIIDGQPTAPAAASVRPAGRRLPPIVDVHAHPPMPSFTAALRRCDPDGLARIAELRLVLEEWTPAKGIALMDEFGIEAMIMSNPLGFAGEQGADAVALVRRINDEMAEVVARHPQRFGAFAMLPLFDVEASVAELRRALDILGFDGVCLLTNVAGTYIGDPHFAALFAELNERRSVAFVHPATPPYFASMNLPFDASLIEFMVESNRAAASFVLSGMRAAFPDFAYVASHGGGTTPYLVHRFATGQLATAAYGIKMSPEEIRRGFQSLHYELTSATGPEQIVTMCGFASPDHLMLGFDYPIRPTRLIAPACADLADAALIDDAMLAGIARGNALRLLPRTAARLAR